VHHAAAQTWLSGAGPWATCLLAQSAFIRLSMNPRIAQMPIDCRSAVALLAGLVAHPMHQFLVSNLTWTDNSLSPLLPNIVGHRQVSDAALLAIARQQGMEIVTFDRGLARLSPWPSHVQVLTP
jgi:Predicted nucleic acid-binding protein, contains PIN domain